MDKFLQSETRKRRRAVALNRYASLNWNIKKIEIEGIFREVFDGVEVSGKSFHVSSGLNHPLSNVKHIGYDEVQITHPMRFTENVVITKKDDKVEYDHKKEFGAQLSICYKKNGGVDVFLSPAINKDRVEPKKDLLIFYTRDPNDLTRKLILGFIRKYLVFQRVDSVFERSSLWEDLYIECLYFLDVRNREKTRSIVFRVMNHWGAIAITIIATWVITKTS